MVLADALRVQEAKLGIHAVKVALRWIKNYTELDFRSLGSYTYADLEHIAAACDVSRFHLARAFGLATGRPVIRQKPQEETDDA